MEHCDATVVPRPDHVDRFAAPCTGSPGPGRAHRATSGDARARSCSPPPRDSRTRGSRRRCGCARTPCASGAAAGARHPGWRRWATRNAPAGHRCSPRCRSPRSRRWPARHRPMPGCRCRGGRCPELARHAVAERDLRVHLDGHGAPLAVRGRPQTLAVPVVDLHHRSRLRRQSHSGCSTSTTGCGTGNRWGATIM